MYIPYDSTRVAQHDFLCITVMTSMISIQQSMLLFAQLCLHALGCGMPHVISCQKVSDVCHGIVMTHVSHLHAYNHLLCVKIKPCVRGQS